MANQQMVTVAIDLADEVAVREHLRTMHAVDYDVDDWTREHDRLHEWKSYRPNTNHGHNQPLPSLPGRQFLLGNGTVETKVPRRKPSKPFRLAESVHPNAKEINEFIAGGEN